eukprot:jgi/Mesvir1/221/Mv13567-RA.1
MMVPALAKGSLEKVHNAMAYTLSSSSMRLSKKRFSLGCMLFLAELLYNYMAAEGYRDDASFFCPCVDRSSARFSFLTHFDTLTSTAGALLHASVRQAARDRGVQLSVYNYDPVIRYNVRAAADFLEDEIETGTAGIVASLDTDQLTQWFSSANAAGIPLYLVGGGDPDLVKALQSRESYMGGPIRAAICYIGPNEASLASRIAALLLAQGVDHIECITTNVDNTRWPSRCWLVQHSFLGAGGPSANMLLVLGDVPQAVLGVLQHHPNLRVAMVVEDVATYASVAASLPPGADVVVVVYETSVKVLGDIRAGKSVLAVDLAMYTQGYLALALASVEHRNGQMVTSNIDTEARVYGEGALAVTDEVIQREVCRAAGNPVCGDPGVHPVTPTGCACFNRTEVRYKVVGSIPRRLLTSYHFYQGMVDAQMDLPGSTFRWNLFDDILVMEQIKEYMEVVNSSFYRGVISFDAYTVDTNLAVLNAMLAVANTGKPVYLSFLQTPAPSLQAWLDRYKARFFVGPLGWDVGRHMADLALIANGQHMLIHNGAGYIPSSWFWMGSVAINYMGEGFAFPTNIFFDFPATKRGNPVNRTGPWAMYSDPLTNRSVQIMNGLSVVQGDAFVGPLHDRLFEDARGAAQTDTVVITSYTSSFGPVAMAMLKNLTRVEQPGRPPVRLMTYKCTHSEFQALLRWNLTENEELLLGCLDEQFYLATYLLANAAALEQQTGERILGQVGTDRLLRHDLLPFRYPWRVACEVANAARFSKGILGAFNPLCDARHGCIEAGMSAPADARPCSGRGTCQFPKRAPAGTTDGSQGTCLCHHGWTGPFCGVRLDMSNEEAGYRRHVLLAVFLACGLAMMALALFLTGRYVRRARAGVQEGAQLLQALVRNGQLVAAEASITAVVLDVAELSTLLLWDGETTRKALSVLHAVMRLFLPKYGGREASWHDGAFTLVFHDPVDALGFTMALQCGLLHPGLFLEDEVLPHPGSPMALLKQHLRRSLDHVPRDWPSMLSQHAGTLETMCPSTGSVLYRGLRVRAGIHVGVLDAKKTSPNNKQVYEGAFVDVATAICHLATGGQVLMSMQAWQSLGVHVTSIVCHHMGMHQVSEGLPPIHLMQVLPKTLAKRAPFPPLKSVKQLVASFFDAPASEFYVAGKLPTDPVVIVFMYVASAKILCKSPGYLSGVELLVEFVQQRLAEFEAYEVEEKGGNFLLAFRSAANAARFAEVIQREAMQLQWSPKLLEEEQAAEVIEPAMPDGHGGMTKEMRVFRGLRLQIGMCMDVPSDCQPHMATGRAAYFGPVVNRAARIAATAAPGQTLVNQECYASAKDCCGRVLQWRDLGEFELKGVKEPMHLYQVSGPELSGRLFPRTLKLASLKVTEPIVAFDATLPGAAAGDDIVASGPPLPAHSNTEQLSERPGGRNHRISRLPMSLGATDANNDTSSVMSTPLVRLSPLAKPGGQGQQLWGRTSEEGKGRAGCPAR